MSGARDSQPSGRTAFLASGALLGFASNSLLCRASLGASLIDAWTFTLLRLAGGALILVALARQRLMRAADRKPLDRSAVLRALALLAYALPFSLAYVRLPAGTGAFVLFGCVQIVMIGSDLMKGRGARPREWAGLLLALGGLAWLTRPGSGSPDAAGLLWMALAGLAWGAYSLLGRGVDAPLVASAWNFSLAFLALVLMAAVAQPLSHASPRGISLAVIAGAVTSGLAYVAWYAALPRLSATRAAILQLCVPPLAALLGVSFLGETLSPRLALSGPLILGGIALAVSTPSTRNR